MGVSRLSKITLLVPRSDMPEASGYIAEIGKFHPISTESETYDKGLSQLASNAYRISSELGFIIDNLGMDLNPSAMQKAFAGLKYDQTEFEAANWAEYVSELESRATPIIQSLGELIRQRRALEKKRDDLLSLQRAIGALSTYNIDLGALSRLKRLHAEFVIVDTKDLEELRKSLPESTIITTPLNANEVAVLVTGTLDQADRISKTLRSFDARALAIPKDLPQSPQAAYTEIGKRLGEIQTQITQNQKQTEDGVKSVKKSESILGLKEAADLAYRVLDELKKSGKLKRISMVQGYVPTEVVPRLESRIGGRWPLLKEEINPQESYAEGLHEAETGVEEIDQPPTLFPKSNKAVEASRPITLTSGPPVYGEIDPTPIVAVTFPIFYGLMFGDVGHGVLLMILGVVIFWRGTVDFKNWGVLLLLAGICATIVGLIVGEVFGFELPFSFTKAVGLGWLEPLKQEISSSNPQGLAFNTSTVIFFIKTTIYIGILDIYLGLGISVLNKIRTSDYWHLLASVLPTISGYSFFLVFGFAFKAEHFNLGATMSGSNTQANIGLYGLIASIVWLFLAGPLLAKSGKIHGSVLSEVGLATMEFLEWVVSKFVGNTVSYVRLAILLIVHAALLSAINLLFYSYGIYSAPIIVVLNLLVFSFEGLIVYVQSLRLHLYEFFSKFYVGTGTEFNSITPELKHVTVKWGSKPKEKSS